MRDFLRNAVILGFALTSVLAASGCTHVMPWERGRLAHPTMTNELAGAAEEHVYAVHEGATGGGAAGGGGCGCN
jgi:hypothetical protein